MNRHEPSQHELPIRPEMQEIDPALVMAQPTMSKALHLCQTLSVKDQAQWSRVMGPSAHNFPHDKLNLFMDLAGNEAPLLWLLHSRRYDLNSLRHVETELERQNRLLREENFALRRAIRATA